MLCCVWLRLGSDRYHPYLSGILFTNGTTIKNTVDWQESAKNRDISIKRKKHSNAKCVSYGICCGELPAPLLCLTRPAVVLGTSWFIKWYNMVPSVCYEHAWRSTPETLYICFRWYTRTIIAFSLSILFTIQYIRNKEQMFHVFTMPVSILSYDWFG